MSFWNFIDHDDSTDDESITSNSKRIESDQFVIAAILHIEKT